MKEYSLDLQDLPGEVWKDIEDFEGKYQVSNKGRVKSLDRYIYRGNQRKPVFFPSQILKLGFTGGRADYIQNCTARLSTGKPKHTSHTHCVNVSVNRLVAKAFIPNPNNLDTVLHIDGDISNNCVENLKWISGKDFRTHYHNKGNMGQNKKKVLCIETGIIYRSLQDAAVAMGLKDNRSNHVSLTYALKKRIASGSTKKENYKPNPDQIWRGYHWKEITE